MHSTAEAVLRSRWWASGLPSRTPGPAAGTAAQEVHRLGAVQAQELETTLWSLGRRTGETREQVAAAYADGGLVRTHTLRQTWHFVHPDDLNRWQAATAERVHRANAPHYRLHGLDDATLRRATDVVCDQLAHGPATRAQLGTRLGARLAAEGSTWAGPRLGMLMMWAELECLVVSGPPAGRQQTYRLWPDQAKPDPEAARVELARRFLSSHGPASVEDLAAWSSLTRTQVRAAVAELAVQRETVDGVELLWVGDLTPARWESPQVELLNGYDEYVSGLSAASKQWLDRARLWRDRPGTPVALLFVDGQLAGHWRRTTVKGAVTVDVLARRPLAADETDALERHATEYGRFLGTDVTVSLRPLE